MPNEDYFPGNTKQVEKWDQNGKKMADTWVDVAARPESTCQTQGKSSGVEEKSKFSSYKRKEAG